MARALIVPAGRDGHVRKSRLFVSLEVDWHRRTLEAEAEVTVLRSRGQALVQQIEAIQARWLKQLHTPGTKLTYGETILVQLFVGDLGTMLHDHQVARSAALAPPPEK